MYGLIQKGATQAKVAFDLGVNKSTICQELKKNKGQKGWRPHQADTLAKRRRLKNTNAARFGVDHWWIVGLLIELYYSPELIAGRLRLVEAFLICPETII